MLGFKRFETAAVTIRGIELVSREDQEKPIQPQTADQKTVGSPVREKEVCSLAPNRFKFV